MLGLAAAPSRPCPVCHHPADPTGRLVDVRPLARVAAKASWVTSSARVRSPVNTRAIRPVLEIGRAQVDANVFEDALDTGRKELLANPTAAADGLRRTLARWRGRAYSDVAEFPGLVDEARRLTDLRLSAVEARIEADLALGRHTAVVGELAALAAEYPLRESLHAKYMLALYRDGRQPSPDAKHG